MQCTTTLAHRSLSDLALDVVPLRQVGRHSMLRLRHLARREWPPAATIYILRTTRPQMTV